MSLATHSLPPPPRSSSAGSSWIQPVEPVEVGTMPCSAIENLCARVYPTATYFFPLQATEDPHQHYTYLCRALRRVLVKFPFLAGNLRLDERGAFSVEIPSAPRAGIRFYYADLSGDYTFPSFGELQTAGFPYADGKSDGLARLSPMPFPAHEDGCPVFIPQLSHVRGGLVLTTSVSHMVCDMVFFQALPNAWAEATREVAMAAAEARPKRPLPMPYAKELVDRSRLIPHNPGPASMKDLARIAKAVPDWILIDPTDYAALENMKSIVPPPYIPLSQAHAEQELRTSISGVWRFPLASLKRLHDAVQAASRTGVKISTGDVLTAYLWKQVFNAKYVPSLNGTHGPHVPAQSEIVYAGEVRRRMNPPLPQGFLGAAVDLFRCSASPSELATHSAEAEDLVALADVATALRESNGEWSEEGYMKLLSISQRTPIAPGLIPRGPIDLLCTDHSRAPSMRTNSWGPKLGTPVAYREPYLGRDPPAGEITVLPRCPNGDLEVMISAERIVMDRLKEDVDLQKRSRRMFVMHDVVAQKARADTKAKL